jgi:Spy/CpxP family protein refolding chaperone
MRGTTKTNSVVLEWSRSFICLAVVTVMVALSGVSADAQQPLRPRREKLVPPDEKGTNPGRRRMDEGTNFPSAQDREYLRLVPQGVAAPRILVRVFRELDLTEEQRGHLENLAKRSGNQMPALNRLRKAQSELLDEALYGETFDPAVIDQRASDLAATQAEIIKLQAKVMTQIRKILTPQQGLKFRTLLTQERDRALEDQRQQNAPVQPPPRQDKPFDQK